LLHAGLSLPASDGDGGGILGMAFASRLRSAAGVIRAPSEGRRNNMRTVGAMVVDPGLLIDIRGN
jgi:hypothetical protein